MKIHLCVVEIRISRQSESASQTDLTSFREMSSFKIFGVAVCMVGILLMLDGSLAQKQKTPKPKKITTSTAQPQTNGVASDADILKISRDIWAAGKNRMNANDFKINLKDNRPPLFKHVNANRLIGTYKNLIDLLQCTNNCGQLENTFIEQIFKTEPMKMLQKKLTEKGLKGMVTKEKIKQYWFDQYQYPKTGFIRTGFKHTFVGEIIKERVVGFHNWVQVYLEGKSLPKRFIYNESITSCPPAIETFSFRWNNAIKGRHSIFLGTSPELEIALYTLCFVTRRDTDCTVEIAGKPQIIVTRTFKDYQNKRATRTLKGQLMTIETAFPWC